MENLNQTEVSIFQQAINELKTAKSVEEWNYVRSKYVDLLTRAELANIDGNGLITQVLGTGR